MAGNPFFQSLDPYAVPDAVTPSDSPSNPEGYARVTPTGTGPAPYDIAAPQNIAGITAAASAAIGLTGGSEGAPTGAGMPDRNSPRQQEALAILQSPQGADSSNVFAGFPDYENQDMRPPALETPIQGEMNSYPTENTYQPGLAQFTSGVSSGLPGVPPETGSMSAPAGDYPGTTQGGITMYGTS